MRLNRLNRWVHHWLTLLLALPLGVVVFSGPLLQLKKHWAWVQPVEQRGSAGRPRIDLDALLAASIVALPDVVRSWDDIDRIDIRPDRGLAKITTHLRHEIQIDLADGRVLQVETRRSDLIESLHDGSWFHPQAKLWVFLPAGVALALSWATGLWMFVWPHIARARRRRAPRAA
jgi:uncharacterized iron-regulated membrane protein